MSKVCYGIARPVYEGANVLSRVRLVVDGVPAGVAPSEVLDWLDDYDVRLDAAVPSSDWTVREQLTAEQAPRVRWPREDDTDEERLDAQVVRDAAHREAEIARLMGPSDDLEAAWLRYCEALVEVSDAYLAVVKGGE